MSGLLRSLIQKNRLLSSTTTNLLKCVRNESKLEQPTHKVNNLERKFLVWTGKYKTVEEVPNYVNQNAMERARNRMRIKISNYMIAATILGCLFMVYLGKRAKSAGESVSQQNIEWHKQMRKEHQEAEAAKAATQK